MAALELLDAASGVDGLVLICIKRMRGAGNFYMMDRVFLAIGPFGCLFCMNSRGNKKFSTTRVVGKDDWAIIFWVNIFFHCGDNGNMENHVLQVARFLYWCTMDFGKETRRKMNRFLILEKRNSLNHYTEA